MVEGLTEFLTGYVLYWQWRESRCYGHWVRRRHAPCRISYERYVRIIAALTQALGIPRRALNRLFFHGEAGDWCSEYQSFLQSYGLSNPALRKQVFHHVTELLSRKYVRIKGLRLR